MGEDNRKHDTQRGAALVEFAILAPLLIVLIMGIIEFGWLFGQFNEIRHSAQEGARWAAVSRPDVNGDTSLDEDDLHARACNAANLPGGTTTEVSAGFVAAATKGATATVTVTANVSSLTGLSFIEVFLPNTLSNTATFRLEQDADWAGYGPLTCP